MGHPAEEVLASEVIETLTKLVKKHGDCPVMVCIPDDGTYHVAPPVFDTDGEGDDCFII